MSADPQIRIRRLAESDMPSVLEIAGNAAEAPHWPRQTFIEMLSGEFSKHRIALVAVEAGSDEAVGFAVARLVQPDAELESIAVSELGRRRGIGRRLLLELVSELCRAGCTALHLEVRTSNTVAIGLYISLGFSQTGRRARYYSDPIEDAVLMTLSLP